MIVLDTTVVSELMRSARDRRVEAWARGLTVETAIMAITLGELLAGVRRLPEGARKGRLHSFVRDVTAPYEAQGLSSSLSTPPRPTSTQRCCRGGASAAFRSPRRTPRSPRSAAPTGRSAPPAT